MANNNIITIALVALLVLLLCKRMSKNRVVVIEPRENFEQVIFDPYSGKPSSNGIKFNMQSNRYLVTPESKKPKNCSCGRYCSCDSNKGDTKWRTKYEPGANNTTDDLVWQYKSPRMTLVDNSIRWDAYGPDSKYNSPPGLPTDSITDTRYTNEAGIRYQQAPYQSDCTSCNRGMYKHQLVSNISTGIRLQPQDKLSQLVQ